MPLLRYRRRRGSTSVVVLLAVPVVSLVLGTALFLAHLILGTDHARTTADAASLAAVGTFVDDRRLLDDPTGAVHLQLVDEARVLGREFGLFNPVLGQPLALLDNPDNHPAGELVFAFTERPRSKTLFATDLTDPDDLRRINAVRVRAEASNRRGTPAFMIGSHLGFVPGNVRAFSTAHLDRDVIGFRPQAERTLNIAPIALLSDPTQANPISWEDQVEPGGSGTTDVFVLDRDTETFTAGMDGLREMDVLLGGGTKVAEVNACLLRVGPGAMGETPFDTLCRQIEQGISREDLAGAPWNGEFVLDAVNELAVPDVFPHPEADDADGVALRACLESVCGCGPTPGPSRPRVFPLFSRLDGGDIILTGFVAARIARVSTRTAPDGTLRLVLSLQPTVVARSTAVTDADRRDIGVTAFPNRYITHVRLVE